MFYWKNNLKGKIPKGGNFDLLYITLDDFLKHIANLDSTNAMGIDDIGPRIMKKSSDLIATHIKHMINLSIESRTSPKHLKMARITPLHKGGDIENPGNYRPISITFSIIFEKLILTNILFDMCLNSTLEEKNTRAKLPL